MKTPNHKFVQKELLKGMTSSLGKGACWGLSVRWLQECISSGPDVAGLAMKTGTTAHEALMSQAEHGNQFLSGMSDDDSIFNCTFMLSQNTLIANRSPISDTGEHMNTAVSIIAAMQSNTYHYGLIVFSCAKGRHAMAITNRCNSWSLFDPNFGTWFFTGNHEGGAPFSFSELLVDNFSHYSVDEVKFFTIESN